MRGPRSETGGEDDSRQPSLNRDIVLRYITMPVSLTSLYLITQAFLSSYIIMRGRLSPIQYFERKRDHIHITSTEVYCYNYFILL